MAAKTKTEAKFGEGDKVIRRTETMQYHRVSPLVGEVVGVLPNGKLQVRWVGTYLSMRGWRTMHSTLSPKALLPATDENIAASQRRMYLRMERHCARAVEKYDRMADAIYARGDDGVLQRRAADGYRKRLLKVREGLEGLDAEREARMEREMEDADQMAMEEAALAADGLA